MTKTQIQSEINRLQAEVEKAKGSPEALPWASILAALLALLQNFLALINPPTPAPTPTPAPSPAPAKGK